MSDKETKSLGVRIQKNAELFKQDFLKCVDNIKKGKVEEDELRMANSLLLGLFAFTALLVPQIPRMVLRGFSIGDSAAASDRVIAEVFRMLGACSLVLVLINYLSSKWTDNAKQDVFRLFAFLYLLLTVVFVVNIYGGGSLLYFLLTLLTGALGYFQAKKGNLLK